MHRPTLLLALLTLATAPVFGDRPAPGTLDEGKLELAWFGGQRGLTFVEADDELAYLWIKPGFDPAGRTVHFTPWEAPVYLGKWGPKRDQDDRRLAEAITREMPGLLATGWAELFPGARLSTEEGELLATGRVVDCTTGSAAGKVFSFYAADGEVAFDLKLVDRATGELLLAMHHTVASKLFTTTTDTKLAKWVQKLVKQAHKRGGFAGLYQKGDEADE